MAFEVKGGSAGQSLNDAINEASGGSDGPPIDRTASSDNKSTSTPTAKLASKQTQTAARPLSSGIAWFGHSLAVGDPASVNAQQRVARMSEANAGISIPDFACAHPGYGSLQLANTPPNAAHTPARQSAIALQVQKIISDVESEVENFTFNDPINAILNPGFALIALNKAYQSAASEPLKRALLADPRVPQLLDGVVNAASYSGEIPDYAGYDPFVNLDYMLRDENIDPALRRALLCASVKEGSKAMDALLNLLPFEDDKIAFGKLIEKKHFKELPPEIRFSILTDIQQFKANYLNKYNLDDSKKSSVAGVIEAFSLLVDKTWFRQPHDRKLALSDQQLFVKLISTATWDGDVQDTLELLGPNGPEVRWENRTDVYGHYAKGIIWLTRPGLEPEAMDMIALNYIWHEFSHAERKDDLTPPDSERRFAGELFAYIKAFKKHNKHMPSQEEVFLLISYKFMLDDYPYIKGALDAETAEGLKIAQRIGELIGLKNATYDDIRKFDSAFLDGQQHLSQLPLSPEAVDNWLSGRAPPFDYDAFKFVF